MARVTRPPALNASAAGEPALLEQREWLRVTLSSIGDAVITTDADGGVTFLNPAAQSLTGWTQAEAAGVPLEAVFRIINEESRKPVENPAARALREGVGRRAGQPQPAHRQGRDGAAHRRQRRPDPQRGGRRRRGRPGLPGHAPNAGGTSGRRRRPSPTPRRSSRP